MARLRRGLLASGLSRFLRVLLASALVLALLPGGAAAQENQGTEEFILTVDNTAFVCSQATAMLKVEGELPATIDMLLSYPIDQVVVKSGTAATVVSSSFWQDAGGVFHATITLSKDVSNYVVWGCGLIWENDPGEF